jgi:hypothetical protein
MITPTGNVRGSPNRVDHQADADCHERVAMNVVRRAILPNDRPGIRTSPHGHNCKKQQHSPRDQSPRWAHPTTPRSPLQRRWFPHPRSGGPGTVCTRVPNAQANRQLAQCLVITARSVCGPHRELGLELANDQFLTGLVDLRHHVHASFKLDGQALGLPLLQRFPDEPALHTYPFGATHPLRQVLT